jgi:hypothetical protein
MSAVNISRQDRAVQKYLKRYAETEIQWAEVLQGPWSQTTVVPACREDLELRQAIASLDNAAAGQGGRPLTIAVINARENAAPETFETNSRALAELTDDATPVGQGAWLNTQQNSDLLVVDRSTAGRRFPNDQGVGLARKIGCDIALALWARGKLEISWIRTTDADALVPLSYFENPMDAGNASAMIFPFHHRLDGSQEFQNATLLYDLWLRYYVLGLGFAASPYAFQTVGSTMAMAPKAYAQVRGFPRKQAAEDFYLLNKLAKVGRIYQRGGEPIHLQGRPSDRVPFGTGAGVAKITRAAEAGQRFTLYDPRTFILLKQWLTAMEAFAEHKDKEQTHAQLKSQDFCEDAIAVLDRLGAFKILMEAAANTTTAKACRRRLHTAFDAFKTLKFVHLVRDHLCPELPWRGALDAAEFVPGHSFEKSTPADAAQLLAPLA